MFKKTYLSFLVVIVFISACTSEEQRATQAYQIYAETAQVARSTALHATEVVATASMRDTQSAATSQAIATENLATSQAQIVTTVEAMGWAIFPGSYAVSTAPDSAGSIVTITVRGVSADFLTSVRVFYETHMLEQGFRRCNGYSQTLSNRSQNTITNRTFSRYVNDETNEYYRTLLSRYHGAGEDNPRIEFSVYLENSCNR